MIQEPIKPGDIVRRKTPSRGVMYFGMPEHQTGVVIDVSDDAVYITGYGDWPHSSLTLEVVGEREQEVDLGRDET